MTMPKLTSYRTKLSTSLSTSSSAPNPITACSRLGAHVGKAVIIAMLASTTFPAMAAVTDAPSTPLPSVQNSSNGIVALVNDQAILKSELEAAISDTREQLSARGQPIPSEAKLQSDVLNALVMRKLQLDMVERAGIRPAPNAVHQQLTEIAQSQGLSSLTQLQRLLDLNKSGSYAKLRAQLIEDESLKILQQSQIARRVRITDQDVEAFLASPEAQRLERIEYRTIHIRIPFTDDFSRITDAEKTQANAIAKRASELLTSLSDAQAVMRQLSDGVAKTYPSQLQGGDMGYHEAAGLPVDMASKITALEVGQVAAPQITPQGIDVVKLVDKRGNDTMVIPQWKVRHILIAPDDTKNEKIAEQQINDIYEQLRRDADFASLAATYSNDQGSAGRGGDLDWVAEGQMVSEFEDMMKRTPVGDFSTPFKSQFGWHILKIEATRQKDVTDTLKRNMAREVLFKRLAPQAQEDWLQELRANAYIKIFN